MVLCAAVLVAFLSEVDLVSHNLGCCALVTVLVLVGPCLNRSNHNHPAALDEILADKFSGLSPRCAVDKVSLAFAVCILEPPLDRQREAGDRRSGIGAAKLWISG